VRARQGRAPAVAPTGWLRVDYGRLSDLLLPVSVGLWGLGVARTDASALGPYGLPAVLPVIFYVALAVLVVSAGYELSRAELSGWRLAMHAVALVVMLYGTAPLIYPAGRYSWLYKTIGVVQYINAHGQLNSQIDIYQNWPGFFAFTAWFDKIAGVASPLAYAKWSQLVVELAALPLLYLVFGALFLPVRQRWAAMLLYSAGNWVAQDYFSPQALGTLLSLGIVAIILRWLHSGNSSGNRRRDPPTPESQADPEPGSQAPPRAGNPAVYGAAVLLIFFVLTFTHELSPYLLTVQVAALAVFRLVRPRWFPIALGAIAVGYLIPRYGFVSSHYGLLKSIGTFFSNAAPPSFHGGQVPLSQRLIQYSADLLSVGIWSLALAGAWLRRRSRRTVLTLLALTFSPFWVLGIEAYGQEGLLRVYLFSLPWAAALGAAVLVPFPALGEQAKARHSGTNEAAIALRGRSGRGALRAPLALGIVVALFLLAFFGDDGFNVMPPGEVAAVTSFLDVAPAGPIYSPIIDAPLADTWRYNRFPLTPIFGQFSLLGKKHATSSIANVIAAAARLRTRGHSPAYIVITPNMLAYSEAYGVVPASSFAVLLAALARSRSWKLILRQSDTLIYELPPLASTPGA
jgi:hypothetical protein